MISEVFQEALGSLGELESFMMSDHCASCRKRVFKINRFQPRAVFKHVIRNAGDAKADLGKVDQKVIAVKLNFRQKLQSLCSKNLMEVFACSTLRCKHQDRIIQKRFQ